jgi:hypothetical protein
MLSSLKIILVNGNGRVIFPVLSVLKMKMVSTYSLSAQRPNMFGACWIILWGLIAERIVWSNIGFGFIRFFHRPPISMQLGWLLFSGAFGVLEMRCALIKRG